MCIKGTVEEEMADIAMRLMDLAGLRGIDVAILDREVIMPLPEMSFTEYAMNLTSSLTQVCITTEGIVNEALQCVYEIANHYGIDLIYHIAQKIIYNKHRPPQHGKPYCDLLKSKNNASHPPATHGDLPPPLATHRAMLPQTPPLTRSHFP